MSKPRQGPALFDLIAEKKQPEAHRILRIPGAWPDEVDSAETLDRDEIPAAVEPVAPVESMGATRKGFFGSGLRVDGQRVSLSVTSYGAAIAMFLVLVVLSAAFTLGQRSGVRSGYQMALEQSRASVDGQDELEAARHAQAVPGLVAPLLEHVPGTVVEQPVKLASKTPSPVEKPAFGPTWQRDHTYVVAQEFTAPKMQDAVVAQSYLSKHGIDATMIPQSGGGVWLMTLQGYNHKDPMQKKQSDQLLEKIRSVGKSYYAQGGGYKMEGYFKTLKGDRW